MQYQSVIPQQFSWCAQLDLKKDFSYLLTDRMKKMGVCATSSKDAVYEYFNLQKRLVAAHGRTIVKSQEFTCPPLYAAALANLEKEISCGGNLVPYLSDNILKANFNDDLLNDWNIYHLHLSKQFRPDGFVKRSDYEIFIYFTEQTAYLIQIYPHSKTNLYATQAMVKIIYDNWPQLIEKHRYDGAVCLEEDLDDEAYAQLRKAHVTTFVQIGREKIFAMIGGGYMSNGFSGEALRNADYWLNCLRIYEQEIVNNILPVLTCIETLKGQVTATLNFHLLWIAEQTITLFEQVNGVVVQFDNVQSMIRVCYPVDVFGVERNPLQQLMICV